MKKITLITVFIVPATFMSGQIIHVPSDQPTIQAGINDANSGDTVLVDTGIYLENISFMGKAITVASNFIMDGDTNHINNTILNGNQHGPAVSFTSGEDTTSVLIGFTITNGSGMWDPVWQAMAGGGIAFYNSGGKVAFNKIINNHVAHPSAYAGGGGIGSLLTSGSHWMIIENNTISNNSVTAGGFSAFAGGLGITMNARIKGNIIENNSCVNESNIFDTESNGGGVEIEDATQIGIEVFFNDNVVKSNTAGGRIVNGAGVKVHWTNPEITGNEISYNSGNALITNYGGGLCIWEPLQDLQISGNYIGYNSATGNEADGGGVFLYLAENTEFIDNEISFNSCITDHAWYGAGFCCVAPSGTTKIISNEFTSNSGPVQPIGAGGGLWINDAVEARVQVDGNRFRNNSAYNGGGIFERSCYNFNLINNIFSGNNTYYAGGIALYHPTLKSGETIKQTKEFQPEIINNTFVKDSSIGQGGAIRYESELGLNAPEILNCIFRENGLTTIVNASNVTLEISYSDINLNHIVGMWTGEGNIDFDPLFIPVDPFYHLSSASPCINSGLQNLLTPAHDYDREDRPDPVDWVIDMGADEFWDIPEAPVALEPDTIGPDLFTALWRCSIPLALGYYLDVAYDINFEDFVPGYENLDVGPDTSKTISDLEGVAYYYRVRAYNAVWTSANSETIIVQGVGIENPSVQCSMFRVQNYPNPFSDHTAIEFYLPQDRQVFLIIYDLTGRKIETLVSGKLEKGEHIYTLNAKNLRNGIYIYRLSAGEEVVTGKLVVSKY
jgi:hypothetical protein